MSFNSSNENLSSSFQPHLLMIIERGPVKGVVSPWQCLYTWSGKCNTVEPPNSGCVGNFDGVPYSEVEP